MRRIWHILFTLSLIVISIGIVHAAEFEVDFPAVSGPSGTSFDPQEVGTVGPLGWIRYAYYLAFALIGLAALWGLLQAAIARLGSANSEKIAEANDRIKGVMIGLALAATAVATLQLLNPDLTKLVQPQITGLDSAPFDFGDGLDGPQDYGDVCKTDEDCLDVSWAPDVSFAENLRCDESVGRCRVGPGLTCGNVRDADLPGKPPGGNPCFTGYFCDTATLQFEQCKEKRGVGGDCEEEQGDACLSGVCSNNKCTAPNTLTPAPEDDALCDTNDPNACAAFPGYTCKPSSPFVTQGTCAPPTTTACNDGLDNDSDGKRDLEDSGCSDANDNSEGITVVSSACSDTLDNDGDGETDYPADPGCANTADTDETNSTTTPPPALPAFHAEACGENGYLANNRELEWVNIGVTPLTAPAGVTREIRVRVMCRQLGDTSGSTGTYPSNGGRVTVAYNDGVLVEGLTPSPGTSGSDGWVVFTARPQRSPSNWIINAFVAGSYMVATGSLNITE